ncbi:MAG: LysM peptidoglycan-binding domain-containing protein [Candidatus Hydrogenedentes bacterium]|nr:LysM peptidoglycan-binding domain-containing protein [Candidatus Hydrogenedentota bacterium]
MILQLIAAGLCSLAGIQASVSPDQLLPVVHLDEPLLLEIGAGATGVHDLIVSLSPEGKPEIQTTVLEKEPLEAGVPRWFTVPFVDAQPGPYTCTIRLDAADSPPVWEGRVTRIVRPNLAVPLPVFVDAAGADPALAGILAATGMHTVRVPREHPAWEQWLREIKRWKLGLIPESSLEEVAGLSESLNAQFTCTELSGWHVHPAGPDTAQTGTPALACNLVPLWRIADAAADSTFEFAPQTVLLEGIVTPQRIADLEQRWARVQYQDAARIGWYLPMDASLAAAPFALIKILVSAWSAGVHTFGLDHRYIDPATVAPLIPALQAWAPWLRDSEYVGPIPGGSGAVLHLFRKSDQWMITGWSSSGETVGVDPAKLTRDSQLSARDPWFRESALENGQWKLGAAPQYLFGAEFDVVRGILDSNAHGAVAAFAANRVLPEFVPPVLSAHLAAMAQESRIAPNRKRYLEILTLFPDLEQRWHAGKIPGDQARTLLAHLRQLALALAALEEFSGEPFLEPLQETLARCGEYQSVYLTNSSSDTQNKKRGDWMLREIRTLSERADWLAKHGRPIEASAVGLLAEWRARTLDYAAKAGPLSERSLEEVLGAGAAAAQAAPGLPAQASGPITHTVKKGDTLDKICKQYGVKLGDFLAWNKIKANKKLRVGETFVVHGGANAAAAKPEATPEAQPEAKPETEAAPAPAEAAPDQAAPADGAGGELKHTVKRGENPSIIAGKYKVPLDDLLKWNKLTKRSRLNIGDILIVRPAQ